LHHGELIVYYAGYVLVYKGVVGKVRGSFAAGGKTLVRLSGYLYPIAPRIWDQ
jgi:hypothetical protein